MMRVHSSVHARPLVNMECERAGTAGDATGCRHNHERTPGTHADTVPFRHPRLMTRAFKAAERGVIATQASAQYLEEFRAAAAASSIMHQEVLSQVEQLADLATAAASTAAKGALLVAETCYDSTLVASAPDTAYRSMQNRSPAPTQGPSRALQEQHDRIYLHLSLLKQLLNDPAGLLEPGAAAALSAMKEIGVHAEWAWFEQQYRPLARFYRLLHELKCRNKSSFSLIDTTSTELLLHAASSLHWLLKPWSAGEQEAAALQQDVLLDEQQPQPQDLVTATAKAQALKDLYISYKMQAILAAPSRYVQLAEQARHMRWWIRAEGIAQAQVWQREQRAAAKALAQAAARRALASASRGGACSRGTSVVNASPTPSATFVAGRSCDHSPSAHLPKQSTIVERLSWGKRLLLGRLTSEPSDPSTLGTSDCSSSPPTVRQDSSPKAIHAANSCNTSPACTSGARWSHPLNMEFNHAATSTAELHPSVSDDTSRILQPALVTPIGRSAASCSRLGRTSVSPAAARRQVSFVV